MAEITTIQEAGSLMVINYDDGSKKIAYPTPTGLWVVRNGADVPPPESPPVSNGRFKAPFPGNPSSGYGSRPGGFHQGVDWASQNGATLGTPIPAAGAGTVYAAGESGGFGWRVIIDHGNKEYTLYAHMNFTTYVKAGDVVSQGTHLGPVGDTGRSFGAHLHFETHVGGLRWTNPGSHVNPLQFLADRA